VAKSKDRYPTFTGTRVMVSLPKIAITFTTTVYLPARSSVLDADHFRRGKSSERPRTGFLFSNFGGSEKPAKASPSVASPSA